MTSLEMLVAAGLAVALSWFPLSAAPAGSLGSSYQYLLTQAAGLHLRYGRDLVFTFGPIGWLANPVGASHLQLVGAFVVVAALRLAGFVALGRLVRRSGPGWLADIVVLAAGVFGRSANPEILGCCLVLIVLDRLLDVRRPVGLRALVLIGLAGGAALAMKFGIGELVTAAGLCLAVAAGGEIRRRESTAGGRWAPIRYSILAAALLLASVAVGLLASWLLAGQRLADLTPFLRGSRQMQSGYQAAMTDNVVPGLWEWFAVAAGLALLVTFAILSVVRAAGHRLRAAAAGTAAAVTTYYLLLEGFVRHEPGHDLAAQSLILQVAIGYLAGSAALLPPRPPPPRQRPGRRPVMLPSVAGACIGVFLITDAFGAGALHRQPQGVSQAGWLATDIDRILHPADQRAATASALVDTARADRYPSAIVSALTGRRAVPVPWDVTGMVAHGIVPATLPVPQTYSAYTPYLDRLNAAAILAPDAPPVLRRAGLAISNRNPMWESPLFMTDLVCHYRQVMYRGGYQLLVHAPRRCAIARRVLETVKVPAGATIAVPRPSHPGAGVVMTFTANVPFATRLVQSLSRAPREWWVRVGPTRAYRLAPDNSRQPMIVRMPPGLWSPAASIGADDPMLQFSGMGAVVVTFRELMRISG